MIFLANENIPLNSIKIIRESGYDISAIIEDNPGITDEQVLKIALLENRIILTFDRDYGELIFKRKLPLDSGVIYFRIIPFTPEETAFIFFNLFKIQDLSLEGKFTIVERDKIRQRSLLKDSSTKNNSTRIS